MDSKLILLLLATLFVVTVVSAEDKECTANYTLSFFAWTSKKPKPVRVGLHQFECQEEGEQENGGHFPVVQGSFEVTAVTKDGKSMKVGKSCKQRYVSNRVNFVRVELPRCIRNITALTLKYDRGVNSTQDAVLNVQRLYVRRFLSPQVGIFSRRNQTAVLEPGKANTFKRSCFLNSIDDDLLDGLKDTGVLCEDMSVDDNVFWDD